MNRNTKIILGIGAGIGLAYFLFGRRKSAKAPAQKMTSGQIESEVEIPDVAIEDAENEPQTRDEQIAFILMNADSNVKEEASGFEGTKFVWNKNYGRYYPVGVIQEGEMPEYADSVFLGFEGEDADPVQEAVDGLDKLSSKELSLAYNLTKYKKFNPKAISEEEALREISNNDKKLIEIVKIKIKPVLNDVKILRKHPKWSERLAERRAKMEERMKERAKTCGRRPISKDKLKEYKMCIKNVSSKQEPTNVFTRIKENKVQKTKQQQSRRSPRMEKRSSINGAEFTDSRQKAFSEQVTNRMAGGMFAGRRFDGRSNYQEETMVREGDFSNGDGRVKPPRTTKRKGMSSADGSTFNDKRQEAFANQVTNRMAGGMFAGRRFDGRTNEAEELLVREGDI
jgi:hypothetical protein